MKLRSISFAALALLVFHTLALSAFAGTPPAPSADPTGINKCRFISLDTPDSGGDSALRVNLTSLHHVSPPYTGGVTIAFTAFEGQSVWVGPPAQYIESTATQIPFMASKTQCEPHYQDWTTVGLLHVTGAHIVPNSIYHVENVSIDCAGIEDSPACLPGGVNVSAQLEIPTTRWADVEMPFNPPGTTRQADTADIGATIKKFRGLPGAMIKARTLLLGDTGNQWGEISSILNFDVGFGPIVAAVDSFRGLAYPFQMGQCNGASTIACTTNEICGAAGPCVLRCP